VSVGSNGCERLRTVHRDRDGRDHEVEIVLQCPSLDDEDGAGHLIVAVARDISEPNANYRCWMIGNESLVICTTP
jgi:hypothetical protein